MSRPAPVRGDLPEFPPAAIRTGRAFLSEATVKTHISRILGRLGLRDRVQLVVFAFEHGLA